MDMLKRHVAQGDAAQASAQAHSIKGAAANVGGMALSAAAFAIEQAGKAGRLDTLAALVPELDGSSTGLRKRWSRHENPDRRR